MAQFSITRNRVPRFEERMSKIDSAPIMIMTKDFGGDKIFIYKHNMTKPPQKWKRQVNANLSVDYIRFDVEDWLYQKIESKLRRMGKGEVIFA